jgi:hypothetical protein
MMPTKYLIPAIVFVMVLSSISTLADVVILKNGTELRVEKAWQENGQVWIIFHDMRASIPPSKVERIESNSNSGIQDFDFKKKKNAKLKKISTTPPTDTPPIQTKHTSQTASTPQPAHIKKDQSQIFPNERFRNLRWGTEISALKGLQKIKTAEGPDDITEYLRTKKDLKLGEIALKSIQYSFWRDRLYMVTLWTQGRSNYTALRNEVFRHFGQGRRDDHSLERYLWPDTPNDMMLQYSKDSLQGMLWLRSSDIDRRYRLSQLSGHASYLKWMKSRK